MVDNSWISRDRVSTDAGNRIIRVKVLLTIAVILIGGCATFLVHGLGANATQYQSEGVVIDFGNYKTVWTNISFSETDDPVELLNKACDSHYSTTPIFTDGVLTGIDDGETVTSNDAQHTWDLWYIEKGKYDYVKSDTYSINASDYTLISWAYTETDGKPTIGVDATATSIYGYSMPHSLVTLSPVCTELVGAMDAADIIIGTDDSSNYPSIIAKGKAEHTIDVVGTYTDPSYEAILHAHADMVFCDASAYSHVTVASSLRNSNVNSVVIYDGADLETVLNNIFIVGTAMNYELRAAYLASQIDIALDTLITLTNANEGYKTLVTLSSDPSPFIAGTETYANDMLYKMNGSNAINDPVWPSKTPKTGWRNVTPSIIMDTNPSCIIIFDYGKYPVGSYDEMLNALSDEWKNTDAYTNGKIYLFADGLGEMAQRSGPRIAQLTELVARIVNPDAFTDGVVIPNAIGDDYQDYLKYTSHLGFGE